MHVVKDVLDLGFLDEEGLEVLSVVALGGQGLDGPDMYVDVGAGGLHLAFEVVGERCLAEVGVRGGHEL